MTCSTDITESQPVFKGGIANKKSVDVQESEDLGREYVFVYFDRIPEAGRGHGDCDAAMHLNIPLAFDLSLSWWSSGTSLNTGVDVRSYLEPPGSGGNQGHRQVSSLRWFHPAICLVSFPSSRRCCLISEPKGRKENGLATIGAHLQSERMVGIHG